MRLLLFTGLVLLASLSPLLTAARLFQLKEWRWDRLREHLREEGWFRQIFGLLRPVLLGLFGFLGFLGFLSDDTWLLITLVALAAASLFQIALRRQPSPVWTQKAVVLFATSLAFTGILSLTLSLPPTPYSLLATPYSPLTVAIPLLSPFLLFLSWLLFLPLDRFLKRRVMARAEALRERKRKLIVIGVTGSQGKTTTKELLKHILRDRSPLVTPEHVNSEMGVAEWLNRELPKIADDDERILVIEMGAYRQGEIRLLCAIAQPTMAVLTGIGTQHMALFGSQENLLAAKAELLEALPETGRAYVNGDHDLAREAAKHARCPVTIVGTGGACDIEAFDIEETPRGIRFRAGDTLFEMPLHGTHNVTNVLLAVACAQALGIPLPVCTLALRTFAPLRHTFDVRMENGVTILDSTHNASPASFAAAIEWARGQPAERKVLVTSGLIELGEVEERTHAELGALSAKVFVEAFFTKDRSRKAFERGFGRPVALLPKQPAPLQPGSLLVCVGLVTEERIRSLLPIDAAATVRRGSLQAPGRSPGDTLASSESSESSESSASSS